LGCLAYAVAMSKLRRALLPRGSRRGPGERRRFRIEGQGGEIEADRRTRHYNPGRAERAGEMQRREQQNQLHQGQKLPAALEEIGQGHQQNRGVMAVALRAQKSEPTTANANAAPVSSLRIAQIRSARASAARTGHSTGRPRLAAMPRAVGIWYGVRW